MTVARQAWSGDAQNAGSPPKAEEQPMTKMVQAPLCGKIGRPLKGLGHKSARATCEGLRSRLRFAGRGKRKSTAPSTQEGSAARKTPNPPFFCEIGAHRAAKQPLLDG